MPSEQAETAPGPAPGAAPAGPPVAPVAEAATVHFRIDTLGEKVGMVASALLVLGALLPWGGPSLWSWGPFDLNAHAVVPLSFALLAMLQISSTASLGANVVTLALTSAVSLGSVLSKAGSNLATHDPWGVGMTVTLVGTLVLVVSMDLQRREAGLQYVAMAQRGLELALQPRVQLAMLKLLIPFALAGIAAFVILEVYGDAVANKLGATFILYFFNPLGKEVGIPFALGDTPPFSFPPAIDPALAWGFIVFIDVATAMFFVWNYDHVLKVPFIGPFFAWVERKGNATVIKRPWIGRLAFVGLALYATLPLEGTGAIGGSVVGRAIGLDPIRTFLAVATGSVIRTSLTTLIVLGALAALGLGGH